jgi:hypothetical protein
LRAARSVSAAESDDDDAFSSSSTLTRSARHVSTKFVHFLSGAGLVFSKIQSRPRGLSQTQSGAKGEKAIWTTVSGGLALGGSIVVWFEVVR